MPDSTTIAEILKAASTRLRLESVSNDLLDAQTLLAFSLGRDRIWLIVNYREPISEDVRKGYEALIERRAAGEPLQYITGRQEFFGLDFEVTPAVLIPRPESELIVEEVIRLVSDEEWLSPLIVDVGTGSGCLAIAIAREIPEAEIIAIDISGEALEVARRNASRNVLADRISFVEGDLLDPLTGRSHIIVSNPPYISAAEMADLQREVRDWEPQTALTDHGDGLGFYRRLLADAPRHLLPGGYLICEIGYGQAEAIRTLTDPERWELRFLNDLQGIQRTFVLRLKAWPQ